MHSTPATENARSASMHIGARDMDNRYRYACSKQRPPSTSATSGEDSHFRLKQSALCCALSVVTAAGSAVLLLKYHLHEPFIPDF